MFFSPVWVISCVFKLSFPLNVLSHFELASCFSPVWILSCVFKFPLCENAFHSWSSQMASLLCGSFHGPSKYHFSWMPFSILNRHMVSYVRWGDVSRGDVMSLRLSEWVFHKIGAKIDFCRNSFSGLAPEPVDESPWFYLHYQDRKSWVCFLHVLTHTYTGVWWGKKWYCLPPYNKTDHWHCCEMQLVVCNTIEQ